jgi:hypothetical protein
VSEIGHLQPLVVVAVGVGVGHMVLGVLTVVVVVEQRGEEGEREVASTVVVVSDELAATVTQLHALSPDHTAMVCKVISVHTWHGLLV